MKDLTTREVIEGIFADAATGDLERVLGWWADDGVLEDVTIAKAFVGKDELRDYLGWYFKALPDIRYRPIRLVIDGYTAIVEWQQSAHVVDVFDGVAPSGVEMNLHALDMFHVRDGLVQHEVSWYGDGWFRQRLEGTSGGNVPPPLPVTPRLRKDGTRFESSAQ
jgi:ketosteroid isomerase-like protein